MKTASIRFATAPTPPLDLTWLAGMSITSLRLDRRIATQLSDALRHGIAAAKGTTHSAILVLGGEMLRFSGWDSYSNVVGTTHNAREQAKRTTLLFRGEPGMLRRLHLGLPGFGALLGMALEACPGMQVAFVHVLQQSSAQACFSWHTDTATKDYEDVRKTVVVLLSDTSSSMQIQDEPEFTYSGVGSAALFDSDRVHRSGAASAGTLKIALMLKPMDVPPSVVSSTACAGADAVGGVLGSILGKRSAAEGVSIDLSGAASITKRRAGVEYEPLQRTCGAIVASSRTDEQHRLPTGSQRTCLVDACCNAINTLQPDSTVSLARLRSVAVPQLGNVCEASWASMGDALVVQSAPFALQEATARFRAKGGIMLNVLKAPPGAYVVSMLVTVSGKPNRHAIMVSTHGETHCALGKMMDNGGSMRPFYIEAKDTEHKPAAKHAFEALFEQRVGHTDFAVEAAEVYELVRI